jgi:histone acetyltransferase (RNA polymerase elongator complex component)
MNKSHYIIPIFVPHEGCPHDCVFCNQNSITGSTTKVTGDFVRNTVEDYLKTIPFENRVLEISFFGGTFTAINIEKQNELLEVAKQYKDKGIVDFIRLSTRPDYIDNDILINLKNYSVDIIELGVQSLDSEVLMKSARGHTTGDVTEASNLIKNFGFILGHQIMLGLPGDNFMKDIKTAEGVISLAPELCRIYPALVIKGTPMEQMYNRGVYKPYSLDEAVYICKIIYGMLSSHGINIIRVGLQATEEISEDGEIIDGPFHPAFRELVEGSIYNDMLLNMIPGDYNGSIEVFINNRDISKLYASKKRFFNDIKAQLKTVNIKINQDDSVTRNSLVVIWAGNCKNMSINEYLSEKYKEGYLNLL